jgi:hypothetical protein
VRLGAASPKGLRRRPARAKPSAPEAPTARKGSVGDRRGGEKSRLPASSVCASLPYLKVYQHRPRAQPIPLAAPRVTMTHPRLAHSGALSPRRGWHSDARSARPHSIPIRTANAAYGGDARPAAATPPSFNICVSLAIYIIPECSCGAAMCAPSAEAAHGLARRQRLHARRQDCRGLPAHAPPGRVWDCGRGGVASGQNPTYATPHVTFNLHPIPAVLPSHPGSLAVRVQPLTLRHSVVVLLRCCCVQPFSCSRCCSVCLYGSHLWVGSVGECGIVAHSTCSNIFCT